MERTDNQSLDFEGIFSDARMSKARPLRMLFELYRGHTRKLLMSFFFFLIKQSPVWVLPVVTGNIINIVTGAEPSMTLIWINIAVATVILVQNIPTQVAHVHFMSRAVRHVEAGLRSTLVRKLQHLSISYHSDLRTGKMQAKVLRDVEAIEFLSKQMILSLIPALLNIAVIITFTATKNGWVALFFIITIPLSVALVLSFRRIIRKRNREFRRQIEEMSGQVSETVEMIPVTRAHGLEDVEIRKVDTALRKLRGHGYKLDIVEALFGSSSWVSFQLTQILCLLFTSYLAFNGYMPVGDVVVYQGLFGSILFGVNQIIHVYPQLAKGFESIYSVSEVLLSADTEEYQGTRKPERISGAFEFENVHFRYTNTDNHVLNNFNLSVKPGECIAFVGESGAGKSTVLNMAVGFYRPTIGRIMIDGVPMDELDMREYRHSLAVVPQTTLLFSGTIRDNITYGLTDVPEEKLWRVVEMANLHDVVSGMPEGLDTKVGEHGGKLSGGQRQRIAIARAMIRDPHIIILDEATSALDNISEYHVQQAMRELIKGRTTFIVAHRLSTIRDADRIVVMKNGACVEVGTFEQLMERQGEFYRLKQLQA